MCFCFCAAFPLARALAYKTYKPGKMNVFWKHAEEFTTRGHLIHLAGLTLVRRNAARITCCYGYFLPREVLTFCDTMNEGVI